MVELYRWQWKIVDDLNWYNWFVKKRSYNDTHGAILKSEASALTIASSFVSKRWFYIVTMTLRRWRHVLLENCKNSNACESFIKNVFRFSRWWFDSLSFSRLKLFFHNDSLKHVVQFFLHYFIERWILGSTKIYRSIIYKIIDGITKQVSSGYSAEYKDVPMIIGNNLQCILFTNFHYKREWGRDADCSKLVESSVASTQR